MITLNVERRYGTVTVRVRVTASSIERALELAGRDAPAVSYLEPEPLLRAQERRRVS